VAVGILLAALLSVVVPKHRIARFIQRRQGASIILASLCGILSPLDSFGAIPLSAALFVAGVPPPTVIAFLVSSPLINPNLFFITAGSLGYEMAILRVIGSLLLGMAAGYITQLLISLRWLRHSHLTLRPDTDVAAMWMDPEGPTDGVLSQFRTKLVSLGRFTGRYFFLSIIVASIVSVFTPPSLVSGLLGSHRPLSIFIATAAGIPLSPCSGAAIPVVQELYALGMSKGAVMAFFIAGPATKLPTLIMMRATFHKSVFCLYLTVAIAGALVIGYLCNLI
jgi:uncharacterized membrane protein YraQ (UPF0718 family)